LTESCTLLYPEAIILDSDVYHRVRLEAAGLDTSPEALALEVIKEVGPRGLFLKHRHTRNHLRERKFSELTAQPDPAGGERDPVEVAREKVEWIIANHHPEPLEPARQVELTRILAAADREIGGAK
jgi:trimethylamine--corrinoid protein Co-methyltransferase